MSTLVNARQNVRFRAGWIILLVAAALMTLNHIVVLFVLDNPTLFMGYAAFTAYALVVIALPFRRREPWAWYATWILPIGLAVVAFFDPYVAPFYYAAAATCVVGLLLSMRDFFVGDRRVGPLNP